MKKLTQKLVLSVITMALVVVALGTSTFAWFTLTNKASISAFQAQVTAGEGIEITLGDWNGTTYVAPTSSTLWYTVLPETVIETYISNMYTEFRLDNVTSPDGFTFKNEAGTTLSTNSTAPYLEFKLYFRSSAAQTIVWNYASLGGTKDTWIVNVPSFLDSDSSTTRLLNNPKEVAAWTGARVSVKGTTATFVYQEPTDTVDGVYNTEVAVDSFDLGLVDHDSDPLTDSIYVVGAGTGTPYGAAAYGIAAGKETTYGTTLPTVAATSTRTATDAVMTLGNLADGYYTGDVMVRVWIEGFDADTFDAIFDTELSVQIGFTVAS